MEASNKYLLFVKVRY